MCVCLSEGRIVVNFYRKKAAEKLVFEENMITNLWILEGEDGL